MSKSQKVLAVLRAARLEEAYLASRAEGRKFFTQAVEHAHRREALDYVIDLLMDEKYLQKQAEYFGVK
jgi:hypothetical protein